MVVAAGCYFNPVLLEPALKDPTHSQFLLEDKIKECWVSSLTHHFPGLCFLS